MTKISVILGVVCLVVGAVVGYAFVPKLFGDCAGGICPSNLWTATLSTNSVSPLSASFQNVFTAGSISIGGTAAANQTALQYTATATFPGNTAITLGSSTSATSATSTTVSVPVSGYSVGDPCSEVAYNGATSTSPALLSYDANITAVGSGNATATVLFMNITLASTTFTPTSTATGVSSTVKITCRHAGV